VIKAVSSELHATRKAMVQVPQEGPRIGPHALADAKRGNQFRLGINRDVNPLVAKFRRIARTHVAPFLSDVAPNFVNLQIPGLQVPHPCVHETGAAFSGDEQKTHDGVSVQPREPFRTADRAALKQAMQRTLCVIGIRNEGISRQFGVRFAEGGIAGLAAPALDAALTEVPKSFTGLVLAFSAGHGFSPLAFCGESRQNILGSEERLTPRFGLAPQPVSAGSGAFSQLFNWWRRHRHLRFATARRLDHVGPFVFDSKKSLAFGFRSEYSCCKYIVDRIASIKRSTLAVFRFNKAILNHAFQRCADRSQRVGFVTPKVKADFYQSIPNIREAKPVAFVGGKHQFNYVLKPAAFGFHVINQSLAGFPLIFGKHRKNGKNQLLCFAKFHFGLVALAGQECATLHEVGEHFPIVNRLLYIHNEVYYETNVYSCQEKS
jgi:hypothetical protein